MSISPARIAAFDILLRVETEDSYASELLHSARLDKFSAEDRALATEIVMGVLRWQSRLESAIAEQSSKPLARLDPQVRIALQIGAYQLLHLQRVPRHAAVDESVELVKRARKTSAAGFVNAILRKIQPQPLHEAPSHTSIDGLARSYAHPLWMVQRWHDCFGSEATHAICAADQQVPSTTVRLYDEHAAAELEREGIVLGPGFLLSSARRVQFGDVTKTRAFEEGRITIQDEASQLVALLVGKGTNILDCCAAPGGKTALLAHRNPLARIVATELYQHRAQLLRERVKAANVEVVHIDISNYLASSGFDRILADVPCSGTGTLARNPEIKWRLQPSDLIELHDRQMAILKGALRHLAPGGRLLYSTCSLEREENEGLIDQARSEYSGLRLANLAEELNNLRTEGEFIADPSRLLRGPYLRTLPGIHRCDGFFAALLEQT